MNTKQALCDSGIGRAETFCRHNSIRMPEVMKITKDSRYYAIKSCAFYRPTTIHIATEKCASPGLGGRAWSWPAYAIDRTPYGVIQHELGHHIDIANSSRSIKSKEDLFSYKIYQASREKPLTGYLGTDTDPLTFYMEWFAENFRLFVTNPDMSAKIRPKFYKALIRELLPLEVIGFDLVLKSHNAPPRIILQACKKVADAKISG